MISTKHSFRATQCRSITPNYLVARIFSSKDLIHHTTQVMILMPITMQKYSTFICKKFSTHNQTFIHKLQILIIRPNIRILLLFKA